MNYGNLIYNKIKIWSFYFIRFFEKWMCWKCIFVFVVCFVLKNVNLNAFIGFCVVFYLYEDILKN